METTKSLDKTNQAKINLNLTKINLETNKIITQTKCTNL